MVTLRQPWLTLALTLTQVAGEYVCTVATHAAPRERKSFPVRVNPGPLCSSACEVQLMPRAVAGSTTLVTLRAADALGNRIRHGNHTLKCEVTLVSVWGVQLRGMRDATHRTADEERLADQQEAAAAAEASAGAEAPIALEVLNQGDGTYSVPFCTNRAGTYQLTVKADSKLDGGGGGMHKEPLTCTLRIYANTMVPGLCVLDGAGVVSAWPWA
jgi:hypothetical protein